MTTSKRRIPINGQEAAPAGMADSPGQTAGETMPGGPAEPDAPQSATAAGQTDDLADERDALTRERDALADSLLRLRADFDNFRKRASREMVESRERAQGELLGDLLPVLDNLERALDAAEHHEERKVLSGVRMTRDMFVDLLRRSGVEEIDTIGTPFDPQVHDAIAVHPSPHADGIVAAVLERGYRQGERVLRPARVVVSSGPAGTGGPDPAG
jgi:molecular chaperone GrpE